MMKKYLPVALIIIVLVAGFLYYSSFNKSGLVEKQENSPSEILTDGGGYENSEYGYRVSLPQGFKVEVNSPESVQILPDVEVLGPGPANFIYISIVPESMRSSEAGTIYNYNPQQYEKFLAASEVQDELNLAEGDVPALVGWFAYTLVSRETIDGKEFKNFQNDKPWEFPPGTTENRYIYDDGAKIIILGYYTGGVEGDGAIDAQAAYSILQSFKTN